MCMFTFIAGGTMSDKHSIAEECHNLPELVREAEKGMAVELTRCGEPVAVLLGWRRFERLISNRRGFATAYRDFRNKIGLTELALDPGELFARMLEETPEHHIRL